MNQSLALRNYVVSHISWNFKNRFNKHEILVCNVVMTFPGDIIFGRNITRIFWLMLHYLIYMEYSSVTFLNEFSSTNTKHGMTALIRAEGCWRLFLHSVTTIINGYDLKGNDYIADTSLDKYNIIYIMRMRILRVLLSQQKLFLYFLKKYFICSWCSIEIYAISHFHLCTTTPIISLKTPFPRVQDQFWFDIVIGNMIHVLCGNLTMITHKGVVFIFWIKSSILSYYDTRLKYICI